MGSGENVRRHPQASAFPGPVVSDKGEAPSGECRSMSNHTWREQVATASVSEIFTGAGEMVGAPGGLS